MSEHVDSSSNTIFGFWLYIMTDCIMFASFFAAYAVLHNNTFGGPSAKELFNLPFALAETVVFLASSFTASLAGLAIEKKNKNRVIGWFILTFLLGCTFMAMEFSEWSRLVESGNSWTRSGFLSSYFGLVGTLGMHIVVGLLWMIVLLVPVIRRGLMAVDIKRLTCMRMFWQFLNIVWIFVFSIVYLMGAK